jgi:hypothetical protein
VTPLREEHFRGPNQVTWVDEYLGPVQPVSEKCENELRDAGMIDKVVRHVRLKALLGIPVSETSGETANEEYDWEKGRRERDEGNDWPRRIYRHLYVGGKRWTTEKKEQDRKDPA